MSRTSKLKILFLVIGFFIGVFASCSQAKAADGDLTVTVVTKEDGELVKHIYKSQSENGLSDVKGVFYDYKKHELTLDGADVCRIGIFVYDFDFDEFNVVLKGNNKFTVEEVNKVFMMESPDENEKRVPLIFKGTGSMNIYGNSDDSLRTSNYMGNFCGDFVIDGATINVVDFKPRSEFQYVAYGDGFIMKSGKFDVNVYPAVEVTEKNTKLIYGKLIETKVCPENRIEILGGTFHAKYIYNKGQYENELLVSYYAYVFFVYGYKPVIKGNVVIDIPDELKDIIKLSCGYDIKFKYTEKRGTYAVDLDDPNKVEGLSWNEKTKTLTMDGVFVEGLQIIGDNIHEHINIVVKNENSLGADGKSQGLKLDDIDAYISGDGHLKIYGGFQSTGMSSAEVRKGDKDKERICIDGPHIECVESSALMDKVELKSGTLEFYNKWEPVHNVIGDEDYYYLNGYTALRVSEGLEITGGTMIIKVLPLPYYYKPETYARIDVNPLVVIGRYGDGNVYVKNEMTLEDCTVIVIDESGLYKDKVFGRWASEEEFKFAKKNNAEIIYTTDKKAVPKTNINRFKASVYPSYVTYDGKEKTPKVKVGGLVEGVDYKVTYENNVNVGTAKARIKGIGFYTGEMTVTFEIRKGENISANAAGQLQDKHFIYKVIAEPKSSKKYGKVEVIGLRKKSLKKISIKNTVKLNGKKYKITSIGASVFKGNKKITSVTIGKNVTKIGNKEFFGCKKLKKVVIKATALKKIGKKAFTVKGGKKIKVSVPKKMKKKYKKLFKKYKNVVVK